ncbi:response regulator transcription factor [Ammoniphilus sp. CFH 90114]|uniref:response regulator transcription factor n=1 Tax=Ammoniphilus sp. CFH 90114 TaxID=2493665 RepID=UPI001010035A|nr:response regulator transcription factor [Ammoniphilus sp. CFH 90114]RXT06366.1 response regulator transcription factor [Ammoniphilus sp. CFH 90114]
MEHIKVLLADDDPNVREIIRLYFSNQKMNLIETDRGDHAVDLAKKHSPDLIILDIMMPGMDGFDVCREIRKFSDVPIIMLTAKEEEIDRVLGLEIGADDYMTKPFSPRELLARMKAIFRRLQPKDAQDENAAQTLNFGNFVIDMLKRVVIIDGESLLLRPKEFDLLVHLAKSPGTVFTREQLLEQIWGYDFFGDIRTVDVHIKKIRQRLNPLDYQVIHTMWGVGYKFEVAAS